MIGLISGFNPFLGVVCGVLYGAADLLQKLLIPDMYGARGWTDLNYWGGMFGYVFAYSSLVFMGMCPGMLSRCFRAAIRAIIKKFFFKRAAAAANGAMPLGAVAYPAAELIAAAVGGYVGGWAIMHQVAPTTEKPAFMWRPNPDNSCHRLEEDTYLKQQAVGSDAQASAIATATENARNTRVLRGVDGRDYEITWDPKSGHWRNTASGSYFDPDEFDRWQKDLVKDRKFMDAENEKTRLRQDWFSKGIDAQAALHKQQAEAAAYVSRIQQAALKHDLWNPGGPGLQPPVDFA